MTEKPAGESTTAATAARQRKKRKWDQPAESLISAGLSIGGTFPLNIGGIVGIPLPGSVPLPSAVLPNPIPANAATASLLLPSSSVSKNAAAIVQKLIQPKIQDELIAREIVINDAEPTVRYKLTKRQTQEEIQSSTGAVVITRGKYRPPNALPDSEKPLYLHISAGSHLKDTAERIKAVDRAASMIEDILRQGPNSLPSTIPSYSATSNGQATQLLSTCLFVGFETDPSLNIAARIRGPNDQYINHIMNETGATVVLGNLEPSIIEESQQPFHLYLSSTNPQSLEAARSLAENLLQTIYMECSASRTSSCKAYSAVPPPSKMLRGFQSSGETLAVNANPVASLLCTSRTSVPISPSIIPNGSIIVVPPCSILHSGTIPSSGNLQPHMVSYPYRTVDRGTCYSGYGGIYPQATPLQQVALALKNASPSSTLGLASTTSTVSVSPKPISCTLVETEKRIPQKRKFQELPVSSKESTMYHRTLLQRSECRKPGSEDFGVKNVASMPPPNMLANLKSNQMPRPPPPTMPSAPPPPNFKSPPPPPKSPPPPPKFVAPKSPPQIKNNGEPEINKLNNEPISDTLLKLVEYGEEDDEETDALGKESQGNFLTRKPSSKPFWAV